MMGVTGNPSSASSMAGCSSSASGLEPYLWFSAPQPAMAPGTVTAPGPDPGTRSKPSARIRSADMFAPARPVASSPTSLPSSADQKRANRSPPSPVMCGSTSDRTADAAIAASNALPPSWSTRSATLEAIGWLVATMPFGAYAVERPATGAGASILASCAEGITASAVEHAVVARPRPSNVASCRERMFVRSGWR